jgi:hypothetical protein
MQASTNTQLKHSIAYVNLHAVAHCQQHPAVDCWPLHAQTNYSHP